jgi:hypothetical protein
MFVSVHGSYVGFPFKIMIKPKSVIAMFLHCSARLQVT